MRNAALRWTMLLALIGVMASPGLVEALEGDPDEVVEVTDDDTTLDSGGDPDGTGLDGIVQAVALEARGQAEALVPFIR